MGKANEYKAPAHKSTTVRGSYTSDESSGVGSGTNAIEGFNSDKVMVDSPINNAASVSGNPRGAIGKRSGKKVSSKGNKFDLGC